MALAFSFTVLAGCSLLPTPDPNPISPATTTTSTAPSPPTSTVPIIGLLAFGDAGSGDATQRQVAAQMETWASSHRVDAMLEAGDVVYPDGAPSRFNDSIDAPYATLRASRPLWAALGNHDVMWNNGNNLMAHLSMPDRFYEKLLTNGDITMQILVLDSNAVSTAQTTWLESKLSSGTYRWRIVMFHHPVWSCSKHGNTQSVITSWLPVLTSRNVDLVITGHDHNYQRFEQADTTFVVTGGGGMPTYAVTECSGTPALQASAQRHHFLGIEATSSALSVSAVASTGETLDQVSIS